MDQITENPLRQARKRLGIKQTVLADLTGLSTPTIKRAEQGKSLSAYSITHICAYFSLRYNRRVEPQELGLCSQWIDEESDDRHQPLYNDQAISVQEDNDDDKESDETMNRREAAKKIGVLLGTTFIAPQNLLRPLPWTQFSQIIQERPDVDQSTLSLFESLTEICWQLAKGNELIVVEQILKAFLPRVETLAKQAPSQAQRKAAAIASQGYQLESMLAGHRLNFPAREGYGQLAVLYSRDAQDQNLYIAALSKLGTTFYYEKQLTNALHVYQEALQYVQSVSPLLRSRLYVQTATILALMGQEQKARRYISLAYEHFPENSQSDPSSLFADYGRPSLSLWGGLAWLGLDDPKAAWETLAQVGGLQPGLVISQRNRVEIINHQAETAIALRDQGLFIAYIQEGIKGAMQLGSEKRRREVWDIYDQAKRTWRNDINIIALRKDLLDIESAKVA